MKGIIAAAGTVAVWGLVVMVIGGCSAMYTRGQTYIVPDCDGALLSTDYIHAGHRLHDRARYFIGERSVGYYVITEVEEGELNVIVLTTFGNKAVTMRQRGTDVKVTDYLGHEAIPAPLNILRDIHRLHFMRTGLTFGGVVEDRVSMGGFTVTERLDGSDIVRVVTAEGPTASGTSDVTTARIGADSTIMEREGCDYSVRFVSLEASPPGPPSL